MAGKTLQFGLLASACCAAVGLLAPNALAQTGGQAGAQTGGAANAVPGTSFELAFWQAVATSNDPVLYEAYLKQYPAGTFAAIAHVKVASLHKPAAPLAAPPLVAPMAAPVAGPGTPGLALPVPLFGASSAPDAIGALRDAAAAQHTAEAAQAAAAAAAPQASSAPILADSPVVTALAAPTAPIAPPVFGMPAMPGNPVQDLFGSAAAMPVGSMALLAALTGDGPRTAVPAAAEPARPAMPAAPMALAMAEPLPRPIFAAPVLPTAEALEAAVAQQATPLRMARAAPGLTAPYGVPSSAAVAVVPTGEQAYAYAAPARPQYAALTAPRSRSRRDASTARFARAVVSTAAVSVEMPDATSQISPLGIMLGQIVRTQETPGAQYALQEEVAMPTRPRLMAMPEVAVPESFCSAEQRSAFNEGIYQPALSIAAHNAEVASAYVRKLRTLYDNYQLSGDSSALASVAAEARDFARAANATNSIHDALVNQFEDIMTTPFRSCGAIQ